MAKCAIVKIINYAGANMNKAKKVADYICATKRTTNDLIFAHCLDKADVVSGLQTIEARWQPKGHRLFKHGIFSFGCASMTPDKAREVTTEVLEFFNQYPWVAAIHTNCPRRIHSHFLLGCINLRDGSKFSQSVRELQRFKEYYNTIAERHDLPLVRGYGLTSKPRTDKVVPIIDKPDESDVCETIQPIPDPYSPYRPFAQYQPYQSYHPSLPAPDDGLTPQRRASSVLVEDTIDLFRNDMIMFFGIGYGRKN